ncbi:MAG: NifB/NifX family molybdenum-iron cluster-binding protein [Thermodesulfobacteriota bacterium]|nr:NifB/NifX family molybdenum-iron cluster-binding protein [Thermodesulfobacteriota bacterium]
MKIAVASEKNDIKAEVYPTAGRAPYYLIFEDKKLIKSIKNPFAIGGGGAGYGVIQMLSNENVDLVISGNFGPNMITVFKEKEMKYKIIQKMIVEEALEVEKDL